MKQFTKQKGLTSGGVKRMELPAAADSIERVVDAVNAELDALGCPAKTRAQIDVAIDEIVTNIASYAYALGTGGFAAEYRALADPRGAEICFFDRGTPFNPLAVADPDVTLPAEKRKVGGLGIFLVKKTMDEVDYEYRDGQNILRIRKRF